MHSRLPTQVLSIPHRYVAEAVGVYPSAQTPGHSFPCSVTEQCPGALLAGAAFSIAGNAVGHSTVKHSALLLAVARALLFVERMKRHPCLLQLFVISCPNAS